MTACFEISSDDCARILVEHLPEYNFADPSELPRMRLRICWRVGADGILVHGNHYHPICLRPKAFAHPLQLTIDPIDSRFIDRSSLEMDRIHLVQDASIVGLSLEDSLPRTIGARQGGLFRSPMLPSGCGDTGAGCERPSFGRRCVLAR